MTKKSIKRNYVYNLMYQILRIILPLITIPYLSRVLGAKNIGIYSYTVAVATYFVLFGTLGISLYAQREIAYTNENKEKYSKVFWEIIIIRCLTMIVSLVLFYLFFINGNSYQLYYAILSIELIANIFDISWFFQGLEDFKKIVIRNIIVKIIGILCVFIFIKSSSDLWIYLIIYSMSTFIGNFSLWIYLPKYIIKINEKLELRKHLVPIVGLFIPQIAIQIYTILDKTMIGVLTGDMVMVGNYEQSQNIIRAVLVAITALGTVMSPRIASVISSGKKDEVNKYLSKSYRFVWFLGCPMTLGLIATAQSIIPWFLGNEFEQAISLIMIGSVLIMAIGLNNISGVQYLIPAKKEMLFTKSVVIAALFNFLFNIVFIPKFGANGAIVASIMAEVLIIIVQAYYIRNDINLNIIFAGNIKYVIGSIIMFIPTYAIGFFMKPTITTTIIQAITGILIYGIYLIIIKDKFIYDNFKKYRK